MYYYKTRPRHYNLYIKRIKQNSYHHFVTKPSLTFEVNIFIHRHFNYFLHCIIQKQANIILLKMVSHFIYCLYLVIKFHEIVPRDKLSSNLEMLTSQFSRFIGLSEIHMKFIIS